MYFVYVGTDVLQLLQCKQRACVSAVTFFFLFEKKKSSIHLASSICKAYRDVAEREATFIIYNQTCNAKCLVTIIEGRIKNCSEQNKNKQYV